MLLVLVYALLLVAGNVLAAHWLFLVFGLAFNFGVVLVGPVLLVRYELLARHGAQSIGIALVAQFFITIALGYLIDSELTARAAIARLIALFFGELVYAGLWDMTACQGWRTRVLVAHLGYASVITTTFAISALGVFVPLLAGRLIMVTLLTFAAVWVIVRRAEQQRALQPQGAH